MQVRLEQTETTAHQTTMLEIASFNAPSAILAAKAGADRIELCADYSAGGVTPALPTLHTIRSKLQELNIDTPINIMIRPRGGDFTYSAAEFSQMKSHIQTFKSSTAVTGFVFGILTPDGQIDGVRNAELVDAACPLPCTFHRAVDQVDDLDAAVQIIVDCGFTSILTSGGARSAREGRTRVGEMQREYGGRISIVLGGGVRSANVLELKRETGVEWVHSSAITGADEEVDEQEVRKMVEILRDA
jgi:copper homeostasis protein